MIFSGSQQLFSFFVIFIVSCKIMCYNISYNIGVIMPRKNVNLFEPLNNNQNEYYKIIGKSDLTICVGSSGTAKTFVPTIYAIEQLLSKQIDKVIITRSTVEVGQTLGLLPGLISDKLLPYMQPILNILKSKIVDFGKLDELIEKEKIQMVPIQFLRGLTFDDSIIILDEGQNCTSHELKTALTRIGNNSRCIITGDPGQIDLRNNLDSGLMDLIFRLDRHGLYDYTNDMGLILQDSSKKFDVKDQIQKKDVNLGFVSFTEDDIVRSEIVSLIEKIYKSEVSKNYGQKEHQHKV